MTQREGGIAFLGCYSCGFVEAVGNILLNCAEYQIVDGELRCPICVSPLHDVSPSERAEPVLLPCWAEAFADVELAP